MSEVELEELKLNVGVIIMRMWYFIGVLIMNFFEEFEDNIL